MLWILAALLFACLTVREIIGAKIPRRGYNKPRPIYKPYLAVCLALTLVCAWQPFEIWRFERLLSQVASQLADNRPADVHCNSIADTMLDNESLSVGHANLESGAVVFQYGWCQRLMDYVSHPQRASREEIFSLHLLVHESMHVRGEGNEALAECQAIQRDYRAAKLLGIANELAAKHALDYYLTSYMSRQYQGPFSARYFSHRCAPGNEMDEKLPDSTWLPLYDAER
ncbi:MULTISPECIES: hypothetical protein [Methylomonas]|uniref:hypothetical protein n=1 Tax=Methylomonas TaxID=416 RepID=UPI0012327AE0|nr:hypothetical protein [Methylomonas rhizoryzae]